MKTPNRPNKPFDGVAVEAFYRGLAEGDLAAAHAAAAQTWNDDLRRVLYAEIFERAIEWGDIDVALTAAPFADKTIADADLIRCQTAAIARGKWATALETQERLGQPTLERKFITAVIGGIDARFGDKPRLVKIREARRALVLCRSALNAKECVDCRSVSLFREVARIAADGARQDSPGALLDRLILAAGNHCLTP